MYCWKCGKEIPDGSKFCSYCGVDTKAAPASAPLKAAGEKKEFGPYIAIGAIVLLILIAVTIVIGMVSSADKAAPVPTPTAAAETAAPTPVPTEIPVPTPTAARILSHEEALIYRDIYNAASSGDMSSEEINKLMAEATKPNANSTNDILTDEEAKAFRSAFYSAINYDGMNVEEAIAFAREEAGLE